jgi:hypothetical protein
MRKTEQNKEKIEESQKRSEKVLVPYCRGIRSLELLEPSI